MNQAILVIAFLLWHEARGEGKNGIDHVATVLHNRAVKHTGKHEVSLVHEALKPGQFECMSRTDIVDVPEQLNQTDRDLWLYCVARASTMVNNTFIPLSDADHYFNPAKAMPKWMDRLTNVKTIGRHTFGKLTTKEGGK